MSVSPTPAAPHAPLAGTAFAVQDSTHHRAWLQEQDQIDRLKWLESEKVGHDIGYHRAVWLWNTTHRKGWLDAMRTSGVAGF